MALGNGAVFDGDVVLTTAADHHAHALHVKAVCLSVFVGLADIDFRHNCKELVVSVRLIRADRRSFTEYNVAKREMIQKIGEIDRSGCLLRVQSSWAWTGNHA